MQANAYDPVTQAVLNKIAGYKTKEDVVCEFFGINPEDLGKSVKLKRVGVHYHQRLGDLGVTMPMFIDMFKDTLELDSNGKLINDGRNDTVELESGSGEERDLANDADGGLEAPIKPLKRRKKADTQEVPVAQSVAQ